MPFNLGGPEMFIILAIVLIVFGAGRLPSVMRDMGSGVREFRKAQHDVPDPGSPAPAPAVALPAEGSATAVSAVSPVAAPAPRA